MLLSVVVVEVAPVACVLIGVPIKSTFDAFGKHQCRCGPVVVTACAAMLEAAVFRGIPCLMGGCHCRAPWSSLLLCTPSLLFFFFFVFRVFLHAFAVFRSTLEDAHQRGRLQDGPREPFQPQGEKHANRMTGRGDGGSGSGSGLLS